MMRKGIDRINGAHAWITTVAAFAILLTACHAAKAELVNIVEYETFDTDAGWIAQLHTEQPWYVSYEARP
jgi:hypothetical protein